MTRPLLTAEEARRAIYIDFEGNKAAVPVLLGVHYATNKKVRSAECLAIEQYVLDDTFSSLASGVTVQSDDPRVSYSLSLARLTSVLRTILQRAEAQDRYIVSWSTYDRNVAEIALDEADRERFGERHRNGIHTARRWLADTDPARLPRWSADGGANKLVHYFGESGYVVPDELGPGRTGESLRRLRKSLEAGKSCADLTDGQQQRWLQVLGHNFHDCVGMRHVVRHAAGALAVSG